MPWKPHGYWLTGYYFFGFAGWGKAGSFAYRIMIVFKHGVQESHLHTLRLLRFLRCAYHAKVINTLETVSRMMVFSIVRIFF